MYLEEVEDNISHRHNKWYQQDSSPSRSIDLEDSNELDPPYNNPRLENSNARRRSKTYLHDSSQPDHSNWRRLGSNEDFRVENYHNNIRHFGNSPRDDNIQAVPQDSILCREGSHNNFGL
jgi:hypothetical protein